MTPEHQMATQTFRFRNGEIVTCRSMLNMGRCPPAFAVMARRVEESVSGKFTFDYLCRLLEDMGEMTAFTIIPFDEAELIAHPNYPSLPKAKEPTAFEMLEEEMAQNGHRDFYRKDFIPEA